MQRDHFIFYRSFKNAVQKLPVELQLDMLYTIIDYALDGQEPAADDGIVGAIFDLVRPQIDANNVKYANGCKGAEHGKKGGAPKGNKNAAKNNKQPQNNPKTTPNVNVNVNDNVNDNDTTVVVSNAREVFCKTYAVTDDDTTTDGIDFDALSKAYSASAKWLQIKPFARRMSWIVKNYDKIINGYFTDFGDDPQSKPAQSKYADEELNALFTRFSEYDENVIGGTKHD